MEVSSPIWSYKDNTPLVGLVIVSADGGVSIGCNSKRRERELGGRLRLGGIRQGESGKAKRGEYDKDWFHRVSDVVFSSIWRWRYEAIQTRLYLFQICKDAKILSLKIANESHVCELELVELSVELSNAKKSKSSLRSMDLSSWDCIRVKSISFESLHPVVLRKCYRTASIVLQYASSKYDFLSLDVLFGDFFCCATRGVPVWLNLTENLLFIKERQLFINKRTSLSQIA